MIDGFNVSIAGNILVIKYQGEIMLKDVYKGDFEGEMAQRLQDISSYLKKQFKKITGKSLTLTKVDKEPGIPEQEDVGATVEERLSDAMKKWIGLGKGK